MSYNANANANANTNTNEIRLAQKKQKKKKKTLDMIEKARGIHVIIYSGEKRKISKSQDCSTRAPSSSLTSSAQPLASPSAPSTAWQTPPR